MFALRFCFLNDVGLLNLYNLCPILLIVLQSRYSGFFFFFWDLFFLFSDKNSDVQRTLQTSLKAQTFT